MKNELIKRRIGGFMQLFSMQDYNSKPTQREDKRHISLDSTEYRRWFFKGGCQSCGIRDGLQISNAEKN
ncbi:hypothetical protein [Klebsiella pneumoniae]|uniref:hypothetical protein n=1 Tax=Klebsiella pneumoniae TaxID=573 RepID=UPI000620D00D|nr:hypothetical protein [Klebsiella pneumoniae]AKE78541.1 hypothetical protein Kpn23412_5240 [Klebsiella pneumoniae subsp. pneumoniae]EKZ5468227.1 hypothetical protein [Klebsiella quasipneumoniae]EKU2007275.1 hypothetical protein [Klebsiella pneumoniae]EKZ5479193.1 hypothetical protein [Klebsiella quasipneumoniae]EKZ5643958.1 hypothetical protein [Klebsiella quasipneumoniae]